jgi:hypothetical protein
VSPCQRTVGIGALRGVPTNLRPELNWRAFAVRQNFSNGRRKVVDTGTWHNDAVPAAVSFFGDAQESSAVVLPELHVEVFALNLQFSRLNNVIHFYLEAAEFRQWNSGMEEKFLGIYNFVAVAAQNPRLRWNVWADRRKKGRHPSPHIHRTITEGNVLGRSSP